MGDGESLPRGPAAGSDRGLVRNFTSLIGAALAAISLANIVFLVLVSWISAQPSPYLGILAFLVFPAFLILGLLLVPAGMLLERRRRRKRKPGEVAKFPQIDLNRPAQRNALAFFVSSSAVFLLLSAVGSYRAYEFTDSVEFCGQFCHAVMAPEYTAYLQVAPCPRALRRLPCGPRRERVCDDPSFQVPTRFIRWSSTSIPDRSRLRWRICVPPRRPANAATGQASSTALN